MTTETVLLEIDNPFEDGEDPTIATLSRKFNMAAERFNHCEPMPMFNQAAAERRPIRAEERPDTYVLVVDMQTAQEISQQMPGRTKTWANPPIGLL